MKLSVIIPCFNEETTIIEIINKVKNNPYKNIEILVIDDCSTDRSRNLLKKIESKIDKLIFHKKNLGKGASIRSGLKKATGDILIIQDADLEYNPDEYPILIKPIMQNNADVVYGSRFQGSQPHRVLYFWHSIGNKFLTILSNMFTNLNLTDMECCYKVFKKEIINKISLKENRFGFEPEITAKFARLNCRIFEVGVSYYGRTYSEGKKIGWKDGFSAIKCIIKYGLFN